MTITIHGTPKSRAIRAIWMAEELGLPYAHEPVDFRDGGTQTDAYRALNDMGQVPTLQDGDFVLTESLAINLYLAKKIGGPLAPRNLVEDALMMKWTLFGATQLEPCGLAVLMNSAALPEDKRDPKLVDENLAKAQRPLAHLDLALDHGKGHLVGDRFTAADLNVGMCVYYFRTRPDAIAAHANVAAWWNAIKERPAFKRAMTIRGD